MTPPDSVRQEQARHDGDTWDLASGVGATATAVATSRALATRAGMIDDPFAEPLVRAVGMPMYLDILDDPRPLVDHMRTTPELQRMAYGIAARTKYFDSFLMDATAAGVTQVVILASGLDARPYRLGWPAGTVIYEIDQPQVLNFKRSTIEQLGATPTATLRHVPIDLRDDWPNLLRSNGFDPGQRTAWLAEGLLIYLPPETQDLLFDHITALSPSGSRLATEFFPSVAAFTDDTDDGDSRESHWRRMGFHADLATLVYPGERNHAIEYLTELGWSVEGRTAQELFEANGFEHTEDEMTARFDGFQYISAILNGKADDDTHR